jgi:hypothetical protein
VVTITCAWNTIGLRNTLIFMQSKSLLIAMAAFAVTTTGAQAYGSTIINRANISDTQRSALEQARELRQEGDEKAARDLLVEAGVDENTLHALRQAARNTRTDVMAAVAAGDYDRFIELTADTPLADVVRTKEDFALFKEAHELRVAGARGEARTLFEALGMEPRQRSVRARLHAQLSPNEREALHVARQANDQATVRAILEDAGVLDR